MPEPEQSEVEQPVTGEFEIPDEQVDWADERAQAGVDVQVVYGMIREARGELAMAKARYHLARRSIAVGQPLRNIQDQVVGTRTRLDVLKQMAEEAKTDQGLREPDAFDQAHLALTEVPAGEMMQRLQADGHGDR